jgi:nicotinamidase/pyrazinamidase
MGSASARIPIPLAAVRHMSSGFSIRLQTGDALIAVDVQNDFLPGGSLAVPAGDAVVPAMNRYLAAFGARALPVFATRDWHPSNHCSFKAQGGIWPPHCVAATRGAEFASGLALPPTAVIISKAATVEADAYSGFGGTGLAAHLRAGGVKRLFIGGLATDYCVLNTVRDALAEGFEVLLLADAIRAVEVKAGDGARAQGEMQTRGARTIRHEDLAP